MSTKDPSTPQQSWFVNAIRFFTAPLVNLYYAAVMPTYVLRVLRGNDKK